MTRARIVLLMVTAVGGLAVPAQATFPGENGRIVFAGDEVRTPEGCSYGHPDLYTMDPDGSNIRNLTNSETGETEPVWSPSGKQIAFSYYTVGSDEEGSEVHVMRGDGSGEKTLVTGGYNAHPTWSDHGNWIAYSGSAEAGHDILRVRSDGSRTEPVVTTAADETMPSYAPDGKWIAYARNSSQIWLVRPDGTGAKKLTGDITKGGGFTNLGWAPDGRWIIFTMNRGQGTSYIYRLRRGGTGMKRLAQGRDPAWSPNGKTIMFQALSGKNDTNKGCTEELYRMDPNGSDKHQIPKRDGLQMLFLDWQAR